MDMASITYNDITSPELDAGWLSPTLPGSELPPLPSRGLGQDVVQKHGVKTGAWLRIQCVLGTWEALGST